MFSHLIFLVLAVLLITFAYGMPLPPWVASMYFTAGWGVLLYSLVLGLLYWQGKSRLNKGVAYTLVQIELLFFLAIFLFVLGGGALFGDSLALNGILSLALYLGGLTLFYYSRAKNEQEDAPWKTASQQIRFLLPFVVPFFLFLGMVDLLPLLPQQWLESYFLSAIEIGFILLTLLFLPPLLVYFWQCCPMEDQELKKRLENICAQANFKHGGILDWTLLNRSHTAAILGTLPSFRYILFTKGLQQELTPESIEAVLAHEIGHSQRRHLLLYPFIFLGAVLLTSLFTELATPYLDFYMGKSWLYPFTLFLPYALILWLYFRYVFGFFSRLFERQADLHCFVLKIPPDHMINALDDVAKATGFTHSAPNWHHHSIAERIDFLKQAKLNPQLIERHHRNVKIALLVYTVLLAVGVYLYQNLVV